MNVAALFVRKDSIYKSIEGVDCYDIARDARNYTGALPVIAHPPCRAWGQLSYFAKPRSDEKELSFFAIDMVRKWGGYLNIRGLQSYFQPIFHIRALKMSMVDIRYALISFGGGTKHAKILCSTLLAVSKKICRLYRSGLMLFSILCRAV